jgi:hypothetical protein
MGLDNHEAKAFFGKKTDARLKYTPNRSQSITLIDPNTAELKLRGRQAQMAIVDSDSMTRGLRAEHCTANHAALKNDSRGAQVVNYVIM